MKKKLCIVLLACTSFLSLNALKRKQPEPTRKEKDVESKKIKIETFHDSASHGVRTLRDIAERNHIESYKKQEKIIENFAQLPLDLRESISTKLLYFNNTLLHIIKKEKNIPPLLQAHANPNAKNADQETVFNRYIKQGKSTLAHALLTALGEKLDSTTPDIFGTSPLMNAIKQGDLDLARAIITLIEKQNKLFTLNSVNKAGQTALGLAIQCAPQLIPSLLAHHSIDVNKENDEGLTPLMVATVYNPTAIKSLIDYGANPQYENRDWKTALLLATVQNPNAIAALLNAGASINFVNSRGKTALMLAAKKGKLAALQLLINNGADLNFVNQQGDSALTLAIKGTENSQAVKLLLDHGAHIREVDIRLAQQKPKKKRLLQQALHARKP